MANPGLMLLMTEEMAGRDVEEQLQFCVGSLFEGPAFSFKEAIVIMQLLLHEEIVPNSVVVILDK